MTIKHRRILTLLSVIEAKSLLMIVDDNRKKSKRIVNTELVIWEFVA